MDKTQTSTLKVDIQWNTHNMAINSIQLSDNFLILGGIAHRILGNYPTKDKIFIPKTHFHL